MNRIDRAVIAGLVLLIVAATIAIGGPALAPSKPVAPSPSPGVAAIAAYREGVLSRPTSVNPLAARTQADRDLVALAFRGLVGRGADARPAPALARSWTSTPDGATWTFRLDPAARWTDGQPLTADDVAYTIATLQDPGYHGPGAGSWAGITATAIDPTTVQFVLATPIGGFLDLATQPIIPQHLLGSTPAGAMADAPFGKAPVGSGPYTVIELDRDHAVLVPSTAGGPTSGSAPAAGPAVQAAAAPSGSTNVASDPLATLVPTVRPASTEVGLPRIELTFFDTAGALVAAFRNGEIDAASGLDPAAAAELAATPDARALRYPSTTLAVIALNLRPTQPLFADPRTRLGLLEAIDRTRIAGVILGGAAAPAIGLVPPSSWAFDASASPDGRRDLAGAARSLGEAGWKKVADGWHLSGAKDPATIELLVPERAANPSLFAIGSQVAADWKALGFSVDLREQNAAVIAADHLRTGDFAAALLEIAIGHDPDLYPLLAASQTRTGGANVIGLQDPLLDTLLTAARKPADDVSRRVAYTALQKRLAGGTYLLPIVWPDVVVVVNRRVSGPVVREVADGSERFWDVLTWRLADGR